MRANISFHALDFLIKYVRTHSRGQHLNQISSFEKRLISGFYLKLILFTTIATTWVIALSTLSPADMSNLLVVMYALVAAATTFWFLDGLDYFASLNPIPPSDLLLTLSVTIVMASLMTKYFFFAAFQVSALRYRDIVWIGIVIGFVTYLAHCIMGAVFKRSGHQRKIIFLTTADEEKQVMQALRSKKLAKYYEPVSAEKLDKNLLRSSLACVVISRSELYRFEERENVLEAMISGRDMFDYRELITSIRGHINLENLDLWMFLNQSSRKKTFGRIYYSGKTVTERIFSFILLIVLLPLFLLVAIGVKLTSPGPVFYGQVRLGYLGEPLKLWKFRSMRSDAEKAGHQWSKKGDPRITRFGTFLRKSRIDELPQLWNVIRGEMSLIGPRPERPEFYENLKKDIPLFHFRLLVRPGITGWAQVMGGYTATIRQTKRKLEYDLFYLQKMSPQMDFKIAVKTVTVALKAFIPTATLTSSDRA